MVLVDRGLLQRIVGALVLLALAVIFVPMLFNREDAGRQIVVDAPEMPEAPAAPVIEAQPVEVPEPEVEPFPEEFEIIEENAAAQSETPATPINPAPTPVESAPAPAAPESATAETPPTATEEKRLDTANLPISWSVQLASLSSRENADKLQKTLRSQGYNAYIRTADGMNRVFVGPLVERAEANRLRDQLQRQQKLNGFVVRFKPEQG
ncbi:MULTISPECIES: SPOR domain-containing protein [Pseudomonadaceae]|uniref:SPOR domain-containing protein n=1 Tax=Pseudomonadaceae TaxID=135621 RepID=UPI0015E30294|nr:MULTISPECIES: SPOR domain-containing protein [Pseudomonadaceae]MBC8648237.1 SPOR domain-containing protein [Pseudomonas sp. MT4]QXY90193.1 SPOR domain-containing protein [Pseudomonas sp. MTM4]